MPARIYRYLSFVCLLILLNMPEVFSRDISQYTFRHYTNENGLPQSSIKQIVPDNYGFIWMATEAGLVRFDGRNFKLFNKRNTGILTSRMIDIKRGIDPKKIYALSDTWTFLEIYNGLPHLIETDIYKAFGMLYQPANWDIILPSQWRTLPWERKARQDSIQFNTRNGLSILLTKRYGTFWYKGRDLMAGISYSLPENFIDVFPLDDDLYCLPPDNSNTVLKLSTGGVQRVHLKGAILKRGKHIRRMLCPNITTGDIFISSGTDFYRISKLKDGSLYTELLLSGFDFEKEQIWSAYYDEQNKRLFLGSTNNGLFVLKKKFFITRTAAGPGNNNNVYYEQTAYNDSSVLLGKGVLLSNSSNAARFFPLISNSSNSYGNVIIRARDSTIWTADHRYIYQHSAGATRLLRKFRIDYAYSICQAHDGKFWLGTKRCGLFRFDPDEADPVPRLFIPTSDYIICLTEERPGILWAGTEGHLFRINTNTGKLDTIPELKRKIVRSIYVSKPGEVWICTYEDGLYLCSGNKVTHFPIDRKGYMNIVHKILEDSNGFFWISTNNGLFQVSKSDLLGYVQDRSRIPYYLHYNKDAGFNTNEFNGGSNQVGIRLQNGYFSFSSMDGVVFFDPETIRPELPDKAILIEKVEIDTGEVAATDTILLPGKFTRLNIAVASAYFGAAENIQMEYLLVNSEGKAGWIPMENDGISFNRLPAGYNEITIRKRAGFGPGNYRYKTVTIKVPPSWWETIWFRVLAIAGIAALIWFIVFIRVRYLRKRNRILQTAIDQRTIELKEIINILEDSEHKLGQQLSFQKKLNENIAHDIHTPLKYLALSSRHLLARVQSNQMPTLAEAESISASSERIYQFVKNLLDYLKAHISSGGIMNRTHVNIHQLVQNILPIFEQPAAQSGNTFINEADPELMVYTHPELLKALMHNLLDNAVKHTANGTISINTIRSGTDISLLISDTGSGMPGEIAEKYNQFFRSPSEHIKDVYTGFGFIIIKDIIQLLGGSINLRSQYRYGTVFTVTLRQQ